MWVLNIVVFLVFLGWVNKLSIRIKNLENQLSVGVKTNPLVNQVIPQPIMAQSMPEPSSIVQTASVTSAAPLLPPKSFEQRASGWLTKIGVTALVIGVGLFLQYAISQGWIGIWGRLILGFTVGILLVVLGDLWRNKYGEYAQALTAGGIAIFAFTTYAGYDFYSVINVIFAFFLIFLIATITCALAYRYKSHILASLGIVLMYLAPLILSVHNVTFLVIYTLLLSLSAVIVFRKVFTLEALFLTAMGFFVNYFANLDAFSRTEFQPWTFGALIVLAMIYYLGSAIGVKKHKDSNSLPLANSLEGNIDHSLAAFYVLFSAVLAGAIAGALESTNILPLIYLTTATIIFLAYTYIDRLEFQAINFSLSFVGGAFLVSALLSQFHTIKATSIGMMLISLVLLVAGDYLKRKELRLWGLLVGVVSMIGVFTLSYALKDVAFINQKFGLEMLSMVLLAYAALVYSKSEDREFEKEAHVGVIAIIAGAFWLAVCFEISRYFQISSQNAFNLSISLWSLLYACVLIAIGGRPGWKILRKVSLLLFGFSILKVFLYDAFGLETGYRIVSFIALGVILLSVSFAYQRNKEKIKSFLQE